MWNDKLHIPIHDLVSEHPKLGFVLHAQGIKFYEHADSTVSAISQKYAFNLQQFMTNAIGNTNTNYFTIHYCFISILSNKSFYTCATCTGYL
jgi:hypothetical protein